MKQKNNPDKKERKSPLLVETVGLKNQLFKLNKTIFMQAVALAAFKKISVVSLLTDYLNCSVVHQSKDLWESMGYGKWKKYVDQAWLDFITPQPRTPRIKKYRGVVAMRMEAKDSNENLKPTLIYRNSKEEDETL